MNKQDIIRGAMVEATKEILSTVKFDDGRSLPYFEWDINCGYCEEWALLVQKKLKSIIDCIDLDNTMFKKYEDLPNHVFLKIGKKYYDCECIDGVSSISKLPIYSKNMNCEREDARKNSLTLFQ
jgi:hypothetical protein